MKILKLALFAMLSLGISGMQAMDAAQEPADDNKAPSVSLTQIQPPLNNLATDSTLYFSILPIELQRLIGLLSDLQFMQEAKQLFELLCTTTPDLLTLKNISNLEGYFYYLIRQSMACNGSPEVFFTEAIMHDFKYAVQALLPHIGINTPLIDSSNALQVAAYCGSENVLALLLQSSDVNSQNAEHGWSALHNAVFRGHLEAVKMLLASGADVNQITTYGFSPILIAAARRDIPILRILLRNNNIDVLTPVLFALRNHQFMIARIIVMTYLHQSAMAIEPHVYRSINLLFIIIAMFYMRSNLG